MHVVLQGNAALRGRLETKARQAWGKEWLGTLLL